VGKVSSKTGERLVAWLSHINKVKLLQNNWLFFRVLVNLGLCGPGQPWDETQVEKNMKRIDDFWRFRHELS
jgi:hypothetical protein